MEHFPEYSRHASARPASKPGRTAVGRVSNILRNACRFVGAVTILFALRASADPVTAPVVFPTPTQSIVTSCAGVQAQLYTPHGAALFGGGQFIAHGIGPIYASVTGATNCGSSLSVQFSSQQPVTHFDVNVFNFADAEDTFTISIIGSDGGFQTGSQKIAPGGIGTFSADGSFGIFYITAPKSPRAFGISSLTVTQEVPPPAACPTDSRVHGNPTFPKGTRRVHVTWLSRPGAYPTPTWISGQRYDYVSGTDTLDFDVLDANQNKLLSRSLSLLPVPYTCPATVTPPSTSGEATLDVTALAADGPITLTLQGHICDSVRELARWNDPPPNPYYQCTRELSSVEVSVAPFPTCPADPAAKPVVTPRKRGRSTADVHIDYSFPAGSIDRRATLKSLAFKDGLGRQHDEQVLHTWEGAAANGPYDLTGIALPTDTRQLDLLFEAMAFDPNASCNVVQTAYAAIDCDACNASVGDPVSLIDGSMQFDDVDPLPPLFEQALTRSYQSGQGASGFFGNGWTTPFDQTLNVVSQDDVRMTFLSTRDGNRVAFKTDGTQIWPTGASVPGQLTFASDDGIYFYREPGSRVATAFDTEGYFIGLQDVISGRQLQVTRNYGVGGVDLIGLTAVDSWTGTTWNLTITNAHVSSIAASGGATWQYTYDTGGRLTTVAGPGGALWRTYSYDNDRMTAAYDGAGKLIESHTYDAQGRAISSSGPSEEITSIEYDVAASGTSTTTRVTTADGGVTNVVFETEGSAYRVASRIGGCSSCGARDEVNAYDQNGRVIRRQNADGYITKNEYTGDYLTKTTSFLKPSGCDPATSSTHCRLTPTTLATAALIPTTATIETSYRYDDVDWPDKPTEIATTSVRKPDGTRRQHFAYETPANVLETRAVTGWTGAGSTSVEQTRTTMATRYNGAEGAAFLPDSSATWGPQPPLTKSIDGPRTDVNDVTTFVYYPIASAVPAASRGRLAATRDALGHITRFEDYDAFGNARRVTDPNGVVTSLTTDSIGRVTATTVQGATGCSISLDPLCLTDLTVTRLYDGLGPLLRETRAGGGVTAYDYDGRGRVQKVSRGVSATNLSEQLETTWDPATGRKTMERYLALNGASAAEKRRESYAYDTEGRLSLTTHADATSIAHTYDQSNRLATTRDENHTTPNTQYAYDPAGRMASVRQTLATALGGIVNTGYAYDVQGNLTHVTDPNGNETTYLFDDFGQMLKQVSPVTGLTTYGYNDAGQVTQTVDASGATTLRTYDALGRALTAVSTRGTANEMVSWTYDSGVLGIGRLSSMIDPSGSTSYAYERRGLLRQEQKTIDSASYTTLYGYDADGNRASIGYPSGRTVQYTFDYAGRPLTASAGTTTYVSSASYLPFGPQSSLTFGNGTVQTFQYNARYLPQKNKLTSGATTLADYDYATDAVGNITQLHDAVDPTYNRDFGYDDLNRLTSANGGTSLWGTGAYSYDAMGNMLTQSLGSSRTASFTYAGTLPKLTSVTENSVTRTVSYDAVGNEAAVGSAPYTYSPRNSLRKADGIGYEYDGRGVRTVTVLAGNSVATIAVATPVVSGTAGSGTVTLQSVAPVATTVALTSSNATVLPVPAAVTVAAGQSAATFTFTPGTVTAPTSVDVCAVRDTTVCTTVTVVAPNPVVAISAPTPVVSGAAASATVTLQSAASVATTVTLTSSNATVLPVPSTVSVPAGQSTATFSFSAGSVSASASVTLCAVRESTVCTTVTVVAADSVAAISVPTPVVSGTAASGTVTLQSAPAVATTVTLTSSNATVLPVPAAMTVAGGQSAGTFSFTPGSVSAPTTVTLCAVRDTNVCTDVTVVPANSVSAISAPASVASGTAATATVTLHSAAAAATTVTLTSSNATALPVPATVTVPAGQSAATFSFTPGSVSASTPINLCAVKDTTACTTVTVVPLPAISSVSRTPAALVPGVGAGSGTITLASAAPVALDVTLAASPAGLATVPATVHFAAGATTAPYTFTPLVGVTVATTVTVTATLGNTATATFELDPPIATSIEAPATMASGSTAPFTVHVQGYPVPNGTLTVTSNNPSILTASVATQSGSVYIGTLQAAQTNTSVAVVLSGTSGGATVTTNVTVQACTVSPTAPTVPTTDSVWIEDSWPSWAGFTEPAAGQPGALDATQHASGTKSIFGGTSSTGDPVGFTFGGGSQSSSNTLVAYVLANGCVTAPTALDIVVELANGRDAFGEPLPNEQFHLYWGDGAGIDPYYEYDDGLSIVVVEAPKIRMGEVPAGGQWARLEVPMNVITSSPKAVASLTYRTYGGTVWWDHLGFTTATAAAHITQMTSPTTPHVYGSALTWTATAVGGASSRQFRFERQDGGTWTTVQPYGTSNSYSWTPTSGDIGTHNVRVSVRNTGSVADAEDTRTIPIVITSGSGALLSSPTTVLAKTGEPDQPIALSFSARFATASTGDLERYSLYTPELNLLSETETTADATPSIAYDYIWFNGKPVAQVDVATSTTHWTFTDHLGTPILQTNASGAVEWRAEYEPFGSVYAFRTGATRHQPLRFPGQEADSSDGEREYNIHRWYRSGWGRYTQADPVQSPTSIYSYASLSPVGAMDPLGLATTHTKFRSIRFDGCRVYFINESGTIVHSCAAGSGTHGSTSAQQTIGDEDHQHQGPTPEGTYTLLPREFSGGWKSIFRTPGWGRWRAPLHPTPGTDMHGRDNVFLHGDTRSNRPDSHGCIDVGHCETWARNWAVQEPDSPIFVHVTYSNGQVCN